MCLRIDLPGNFSAKTVYIQTKAVHQYAKFTFERDDFCNMREAVSEPGTIPAPHYG